MPLTKSAIIALRRSQKKAQVNRLIKSRVKSAVKKASTKANLKNLSEAYSQLDTATKKHYLHANKAARLKSKLAKLIKKA